MRRTITIERVVLTNASLRQEDADAFRGAVSTELARLLDERGGPASATSREAIAVPLAQGGELATNVAAAIFDALGKAG